MRDNDDKHCDIIVLATIAESETGFNANMNIKNILLIIGHIMRFPFMTF